MSLLNWFTRRTPKTTTKSNRTVLGVNALEARDVPAAFNLTTVGSSAVVNGAIFRQYNDQAPENVANGQVDSFLRLDDTGRERGYNTDGRVEFDTLRRGTHSIQVSDLPLVTINGQQYREVILDVNEPRRSATISLDELKVYVSNNPNLRGYNSRTGTIGGVRPVYDLDAGRGDNFIRLNAALNNRVGTGDVTVAIPADLLTGGTYFTLYSTFGGRNAAGGGSEQWAPGFGDTTPPPAATYSISGNVYLQFSFDEPAGAPWFDTLVTLTGTDINGNEVLLEVVVPAGSTAFSFSDLAEGTYTVSAKPVDPEIEFLYLNPAEEVTLTADESNVELTFLLAE